MKIVRLIKCLTINDTVMKNERKVLAELMDKVKEAKEVLGVDVIVTLGDSYHPREVRVLPGKMEFYNTKPLCDEQE